MQQNIEILSTSKFKTVSLVLKFKAPLHEDTMTIRSVLSKLIHKTTAKYNTEIDMMNHLADLYGAHLYSSVIKQNNAHVLTLGIDIVNDKYLSDSNVLEAAFQLLHEVLFNPNVINGAFVSKQVKQEKRLLKINLNLLKRILGNMDFISYSNRCSIMIQIVYRVSVMNCNWTI